jgi:hypothetical protein
MNAISMSNLWTYLQGLSLTADNWQWLAEKTSMMSMSVDSANKGIAGKKKYRLSPRMKKLMGSVKINPQDVEGDDRLKYILSK